MLSLHRELMDSIGGVPAEHDTNRFQPALARKVEHYSRGCAWSQEAPILGTRIAGGKLVLNRHTESKSSGCTGTCIEDPELPLSGLANDHLSSKERLLRQQPLPPTQAN